MNDFFPFTSALVGGLLIGSSALLLMLAIGRIAGISGILGQALSKVGAGDSWRWVFLIGLLLGALIYQAMIGFDLPFRDAPATWLLVIGGFLVGFGTYLGSGCTSGHGVCGIGRFSKRSIIATCIFMFAAIVTVFLVRHVFS